MWLGVDYLWSIMKNLYRPDFFKQYQGLLSEGISVEDRRVLMEQTVDKMIDASKRLGFISHFYPAVLLCVAPILLLGISLYIRDGVTAVAIPGVLSILFFVYKRSHLARMVNELSRPNVDMSLSQRLVAKINYLEGGLLAKVYRLTFLQQLYTVFFPWVMVLMAYLIWGAPVDIWEWIVLVVTAYLISTAAWSHLFKAELSELDPMTGDLADIKQAYYKIPLQ